MRSQLCVSRAGNAAVARIREHSQLSAEAIDPPLAYTSSDIENVGPMYRTCCELGVPISATHLGLDPVLVREAEGPAGAHMHCLPVELLGNPGHVWAIDLHDRRFCCIVQNVLVLSLPAVALDVRRARRHHAPAVVRHRDAGRNQAVELRGPDDVNHVLVRALGTEESEHSSAASAGVYNLHPDLLLDGTQIPAEADHRLQLVQRRILQLLSVHQDRGSVPWVVFTELEKKRQVQVGRTFLRNASGVLRAAGREWRRHLPLPNVHVL
mmetsp:Transcript_14878/g.44175  ORF Transcript_14878/g.44175 Transcript_14878/m.44175 type:complete len:267 (+) Transcript_14878:1236-2036(+)